MNQKKFQSWVDSIYETQDEALDCREFQAVMPAYIEAEIAGQPFDSSVTNKVKTHLNYCPDCHELYEGLKYVVEQEEFVTEVPIPDLTAVSPQ